MRMWMVEPRLMCDKHLVKEHGDIHTIVWHIRARHALTGKVEPISIRSRHTQLEEEMSLRKPNTKATPLKRFTLVRKYKMLIVSASASLVELASSCKDCESKVLGE